MEDEALYRVEERLQNGTWKYYLLREMHSNSRKFRATKLIKSGTSPTEAELARVVLLYGFELEMKCCEKIANYRVKTFRYEHPPQENLYVQLERYRYLDIRYHDFLTDDEYRKHVREHEFHYIHESAKTIGCTFTFSDVAEMLTTGKIPDETYLRDVNEVQNMYACALLRNRHPRKVTAALILRIRAMMLEKIEETEPVRPETEAAIQQTLDRYYQRIQKGFHPFEQMILWYKAFRHLHPFKIGTKRVGREVIHYMAMANGYPLPFQTSDQVLNDASVFADLDLGKNIPDILSKYMGDKLPGLEAELRRKITKRWDIQGNKMQKKLDTFLEPEDI